MFAVILKLIIAIELIAILYFVIKSIELYCQHLFCVEYNVDEAQSFAVSKSNMLNENAVTILKNLKEIPYVG